MMMADGGFDVSGKENIQELMNKQLLLTQFAAAVGTLREGGHFVCKAFDLFTPFSAGLLHLMAAHFSAVALYKPAQSRPANSERYVLCRSLRGGGAGAAGLKWRRTSMRAPPHRPTRPALRCGPPLCTRNRGRGRLGASCGAR